MLCVLGHRLQAGRGSPMACRYGGPGYLLGGRRYLNKELSNIDGRGCLYRERTSKGKLGISRAAAAFTTTLQKKSRNFRARVGTQAGGSCAKALQA